MPATKSRNRLSAYATYLKEKKESREARDSSKANTPSSTVKRLTNPRGSATKRQLTPAKAVVKKLKGSFRRRRSARKDAATLISDEGTPIPHRRNEPVQLMSITSKKSSINLTNMHAELIKEGKKLKETNDENKIPAKRSNSASSADRINAKEAKTSLKKSSSEQRMSSSIKQQTEENENVPVESGGQQQQQQQKRSKKIKRVNSHVSVPVSLESLLNHDQCEDSQSEAANLFQWMISPVEPDNFFNNLWERKPLLVRRHTSSYNNGLFSTQDLDRILRENDIQFTQNIDVTTFSDGKRETHNIEGRAHAAVVWDFYQNGCSVRLLNPQTYSRSVWKFNSTLQEYFGSCVGANVYLTPAASQGFAPHYDDIEAFVLQLEGKKHWRLYSPRNNEETLPRYSSGNFTQEEMEEPILDVVLEAGDMLYFPRGTIHQADTPADSHSLHMTVSTCQRNTWGDLLERLLPAALQAAIQEDPELRQSLPRDYMHLAGIANSDSEDPGRGGFLKKIHHLMSKVLSYAQVDTAVDQQAAGFVHDSLPPLLSTGEKECSVFGHGARWRDGGVVQEVQVGEDTEVKLVRKGAVRLVMKDDRVLLYYTTENSMVFHEKEPQFIEIPADAGMAVEFLLHTYPRYVRVGSLPFGNMQNKAAEIIHSIYERGILVTRKPLE